MAAQTPGVDKVRSADGTEIAVERTGEGPALVLVDGAGCFRALGPCGPLAGNLSSDFTVYSYDRRGRGDSGEAGTWSIDREIEDLQAVIGAAGGSAAVYAISSGALLALEAAAKGLAITRLGLFEPPLPAGGGEQELPGKLDELVKAGKRHEAVVTFQTSIGIPPEMIEGMRSMPFWPALEGIAHTLVYDTTISASASADRYVGVGIPVLVIDSGGSSGPMQQSAASIAAAVPGATHRSLEGQFHDVPAEILIPVLTEFFKG